jgi:hypothetical protein
MSRRLSLRNPLTLLDTELLAVFVALDEPFHSVVEQIRESKRDQTGVRNPATAATSAVRSAAADKDKRRQAAAASSLSFMEIVGLHTRAQETTHVAVARTESRVAGGLGITAAAAERLSPRRA